MHTRTHTGAQKGVCWIEAASSKSIRFASCKFWQLSKNLSNSEKLWKTLEKIILSMFGAIFNNSFHLLAAFSFRNSYFPEFTFFVEIFLAHALCIPHSNQSNSALCQYVCSRVCVYVLATCLSLRLSLCLCQVVFPTQAGHLRSEASFKILCSFHVAHIRDTHCTLTYIQMYLCVCIYVWGQPLLSRESHPVCPEPVSASNEFPCSCRCASFFLSVLLYLILQVLRRLLCLLLLLYPVCLQVLSSRFSRTSLSTFLLLGAILLAKNGQIRQ